MVMKPRDIGVISNIKGGQLFKTNNGNLEQYTCRSESEGVNQPRFLFPPITEVVGLAVDADAVPGAFSGC